VDWLKELWADQYWKIAISQFGSWIISPITESLSLVNFSIIGSLESSSSLTQ